ncbi:MAG TPA: reverse transcriptase family protein [Candidatus Methanoperedens sp.]|nr:reverse transcriptase family protein [Candidatus Methanoperedens sp.]
MRTLSALKIRSLNHLYVQLGTSAGEIAGILDNPEKHHRLKTIEKKGKRRNLKIPVGRLKTILRKLNGLLQRTEMPNYIEGGRRGHDIRTNARRHVNKPVVLTGDIKDCFPSISNRRVYGVFVRRLECSPDVASVLTKLTTIDGSLPKGSPTSSIITALATENFAKRLKGLADKHDAGASIYVDDSSISGPRHISRLAGLVKKIGRQEGFEIHKVKSMTGDEEQVVTGIRVNRGFDAPTAKMADVRKQIEQITSSYKGTALERSVRGKVQYLSGLNPGAGNSLRKRLEKRLKEVAASAAPVDGGARNGKKGSSGTTAIPAG